MMRLMNSSNSGTVNAVSPWLGLQIMPFEINWFRVGPSAVTLRLRRSAMSPDRCGPGPMSAMARRYFFSAGVSRSNRTRKKLASRAAIADTAPTATSANVIGDAVATSHACCPPFLEDVGTTLGLAHDLVDRVRIESDAFLLRSPGNGERRGIRWQRANLRELEQPLRVRLGFPHPPSELRQTRADEHDRELALRAAMQRRGERRQLRLVHPPRGLGGGFEERRKVLLEIAVVGEA